MTKKQLSKEIYDLRGLLEETINDRYKDLSIIDAISKRVIKLETELNNIRSSIGQMNKATENIVKSKVGEIVKSLKYNKENLDLIMDYLGVHFEEMGKVIVKNNNCKK